MENHRTNQVPARLLSFIKSNPPSQLTQESNLTDEPPHSWVTPACAVPSPPRQQWPRGATLTRQESVEALQSLAEMGQVNRQRSIDRLPSIDQLSAALSPLTKLQRLSTQLLRRQMIARRFKSLRRYRLQQRLANATATAIQLSPSNLATKLHHSKGHTPQPHRPELYETELAQEQARAQSEQAVDSRDPAENALRRMIGHDLPYGWALAHEMMVNEKFEFNSDGLLLEDPVHRHFVEIFLKANDQEQQTKLLGALVKMSTSGKYSRRRVTAVAKTLQQLSDVLCSITDSQVVHDMLNPKYVCQMISQQAYGPEQLISLVTYCVSLASNASSMETPPILEWLHSVPTKVHAATTTGELLKIAASLLHELLHELKELRTNEMNVRLALYRPCFLRVGAEFERVQVANAIESGALQLVKTAPWLDAAWGTVAAVRLSRDSMVSTHREAVKMLLTELALENKRVVKAGRLPEILALDTHRISRLRTELRRLAVAAALNTLAVGILKGVHVELSDEQNKNLMRDTLEELESAANSDQLCQSILTLIHVAAADKYNELPSEERLVVGLRNACTKREEGSLRALFTTRIATALVSEGDFVVHASLSAITEEVVGLASRVNHLCSHWEQAYGQLYHALLGSR